MGKEIDYTEISRICETLYPYALKGDALGLCPKIVAVADVYDAMTQNRIYKKGVTPFEVFEMFLVNGMEIFDYEVLSTFVKNVSAHLVGLNVLLENGKGYEIVHISPQDVTHTILFDGSSEIIDTSRSNAKIKTVFSKELAYASANYASEQ